MKTSDQTDKIDAALARVHAAIGKVVKDGAVKVEGKSKSSGEEYGYKSGFATLAALDAAARPALHAEGVTILQGGGFVQGLGPVLETRLAFAGQWIESFYPIKVSRDGAQGFGGGISFARRWGLCGMLNIVATDAEETQGYTDAKRDIRPAKAAKAPPGIADALKAIRDAQAVDTLADVAQRARAAFPTGESAAAVEKGLDAWFVSAFSEVVRAQSLDGFTELRDLVAKVKPRGRSVVDAMGEAARRLEP